MISNSTVNIYNSPRARSLAREVVKPLKDPGIEELRIERPDAETLRIRDNETEGFDAPIPDEELVDQELDMYLTVLSPVFVPGNKWRLTGAGIPSLWATVEDERFWTDVESRRDLFGYGDLLHARMRMRQRRTPSGAVDTEWAIVEVLDHSRGSGPPPTLFSEVQDEDGTGGPSTNSE